MPTSTQRPSVRDFRNGVEDLIGVAQTVEEEFRRRDAALRDKPLELARDFGPFGAIYSQQTESITVYTGTFHYLLENLRGWVFSLDVPAVLRGEFPHGASDEGEEGNGARDAFSKLLAETCFAFLIAHELGHAINGHWHVLKQRNEDVRSLDEAGQGSNVDYQALELNADLIAVNWTIDRFLARDQPATPTGRGVTLACVLAALANILSEMSTGERALTDSKYPPAPLRYEAWIRAARGRLRGVSQEALESLDKAMPWAGESIARGVWPHSRAFLAPLTRQEVLEHASAIEREWVGLSARMEGHKLGETILFDSEMRNWRKALDWDSVLSAPAS